MEKAVSAPSPAFFCEHYSVYKRIEMFSVLSECSDLLHALSVDSYADDDLKQYNSLHELAFYLDTFCTSLEETLKSKKI